MAKKSVATLSATDYLGGNASGWTPFHPAVADALRRHIPRKQDHPKAVTAALFLAVCYKWRGRSTRFGNGWFDKTHRQLCEELSCSDNWLDWVIDFLCMPVGDEAPRYGLGLVYRLMDGHSNISKYMLNDGRFKSFWLTNGVQPALSASSDVGLSASSDVGLTASSDVGLHHKDIQKNLQNVCVDALSAFLISHSIWPNKANELAGKLAAAGVGVEAVEAEIKRVYAHTIARTDSVVPVRNVPVFLVQAIESLLISG